MKKPVKKLTKKRQLAVDIAKDVLKHLAARKVKFSTDGYWVEGELPKPLPIADQVQCHLPLIRKHCGVCAKGALFLSYIELKNKVTFSDLGLGLGIVESSIPIEVVGYINLHSVRIREIVSPAFSANNFDLIETAYEGTVIDGKFGRGPTDKEDRAIAFGKKHRSDNQRLTAICKNIIKNDGEFKP